MSTNALGSPETWLDAHGAALYKYALMHTRDEQKAEEAVQETLLAALEARHRYSGNASARTWLVGILKHKIIDLFREETRETALDDVEDVHESPDGEEGISDGGSFEPSGHWLHKLADWGDPESLLERRQFMTVLQQCLDALPQRLARLFMLREVMEEDTRHICQEMAISPTNLWTMLYRARMGLRQCLDRNWIA